MRKIATPRGLPLKSYGPNKCSYKNYLQPIHSSALPAYSAGHCHPVLLQSWPWPLQDPTHQKHPRLDSADMGVGLVHGSGPIAWEWAYCMHGSGPIAWEWDYCMGVGLLHGSGPSASSPIDVTSLLQAGGGPPDRQVAEGGFATLLSCLLSPMVTPPFTGSVQKPRVDHRTAKYHKAALPLFFHSLLSQMFTPLLIGSEQELGVDHRIPK